MNETEIHRVTADLGGVRSFYLDTCTDRDAIVCLHGRYGRAETWVDLFGKYSTEYRIVAPDLRGHGLSEAPPSSYSAEEMAGDVSGLLEHLGIVSAILVGHSLGGRIASYFAALNPDMVQGLAILDKSAQGLANLDGDKPLRFDPLTSSWPLPFPTFAQARQFIAQWAESDLSSDYFMSSLVETVRGYEMMFDSRAIVSGLNQDLDWYHWLPSIKCPTLIVRAKNSEAVPDQELVKLRSGLSNCMVRE
ncbi:MAG: alpha/beta hydrolase, partial [Micrococcales bacterium]|nr:alpha/beta hydrolase [Micrococcales bacterium]